MERGAVAERRAAVWALALAAGYVVALCYAEFDHVEVGPMSGNTIAAAGRIGQHGAAMAITRGVAIAAFVVGVAAGIVIAEECARRFVRRALALTVATELALLVAFTVVALHLSNGSGLHAASNWQVDGLVTLPALAMGCQTAALRRVGGQTVRTVFITGMLTRGAEECVRYAYWQRDRALGNTLPWRNEPSLRRVALLVGIAVTYAAGAAIGAWSDRRWHVSAMVLPLVLLAAIAMLDVVVAGGPPSR